MTRKIADSDEPIYALTSIVTPVLCAACVIEVHKHIRWMVYSGGEG